MVSTWQHDPLVIAGVAVAVAIVSVLVLIARHRRGGASPWPAHWAPRTIVATVVAAIAAFAVILIAEIMLYPRQFR